MPAPALTAEQGSAIDSLRHGDHLVLQGWRWHRQDNNVSMIAVLGFSLVGG
ncbi:hypothetical protein OG885_45470 (plasmid) [Streptomyces sp. NBC_00028]|uniref:hypothetical protein n=1 Tax=Streptomyces sp. NBC_00028 TaxID=2975624 RepID=UPI002F90ABD6